MEGSITISVPNNITAKDIQEIRQQFKNGKCSNDYKLNILISGTEDMTNNMGAFLTAKIR